MKERYCLKCGHPLKKGEACCGKCHFENKEQTLEAMDIHAYKQLCYGNLTSCRERKNRALAFYVISGIALILGLVFLVLSFRYNVIRVRVFTPLSAEFFFCVFFLALFLFSVVYASLMLVPSLSRQEVRFP